MGGLSYRTREVVPGKDCWETEVGLDSAVEDEHRRCCQRTSTEQVVRVVSVVIVRRCWNDKRCVSRREERKYKDGWKRRKGNGHGVVGWQLNGSTPRRQEGAILGGRGGRHTDDGYVREGRFATGRSHFDNRVGPTGEADRVVRVARRLVERLFCGRSEDDFYPYYIPGEVVLRAAGELLRQWQEKRLPDGFCFRSIVFVEDQMGHVRAGCFRRRKVGRRSRETVEYMEEHVCRELMESLCGQAAALCAYRVEDRHGRWVVETQRRVIRGIQLANAVESETEWTVSKMQKVLQELQSSVVTGLDGSDSAEWKTHEAVQMWKQGLREWSAWATSYSQSFKCRSDVLVENKDDILLRGG